VNILLIDDQEVVRQGIRRVFEQSGNEYVFAESGTGAEALRLLREQSWDAAVLEICLHDSDGLELLKDIKRVQPELPVLIFSTHSEQQYAVRAFRAGAAGYISKGSTIQELVNAIKKTANGGRYVSGEIAEQLVNHLERGTNGAPHEILSDREFEVFRWIATGKTVGEIAGLLGLSDKTISTYRARVLRKMGMKTNAELTHYAAHNRIT
jgi:two-component system, NarL family, invasion response regulator UvrY